MTEDQIDLFERGIRLTAAAVTGFGGTVSPLKTQPKATLDEVKAVEAELGYALPAAFADVMLTYARELDFKWFQPDDFSLPEPFRGIFSGECRWSLDGIAKLNADKDGWISEVFPNEGDPYDAVWHNKFAFLNVPNGDYLAIDLAAGANGAVVYLSHDDGAGHGRQLAPDFLSLLMGWSRLGFTGSEDWQWLCLTKQPDGTLDPDGATAKAFRDLIGLEDAKFAKASPDYRLHITRNTDWSNNPDCGGIAQADWTALVAGDDTLQNGANDQAIEQAVWSPGSDNKATNPKRRLSFQDGRIEATNPDIAMRDKLCDLAAALDAAVLDDAGLRYTNTDEPAPPVKRAWWKTLVLKWFGPADN